MTQPIHERRRRKSVPNRRLWMAWEDENVRDFYPYLGNGLTLPGRSAAAISTRASLLHVRRRDLFSDGSDIRHILRCARKKARIPQIVLAEEIGISRGLLGHWERGIRLPVEAHLQCWKDALGYEHG